MRLFLIPVLLFCFSKFTLAQTVDVEEPVETQRKEFVLDVVPLTVAMFVEAPVQLPFSAYLHVPIGRNIYLKIGGHYDVHRVFRTTEDRIFISDSTFLLHDYQRVKQDLYGSIGLEQRIVKENHQIFFGFDLYGGAGADRIRTGIETFRDTSWVEGAVVFHGQTSLEEYTNYYSDKQYHIFGAAPYVGIRKDINRTFAISGIFKPQFIWRVGNERLYSTKAKANFGFSGGDLETGPAFAEIGLHVKL